MYAFFLSHTDLFQQFHKVYSWKKTIKKSYCLGLSRKIITNTLFAWPPGRCYCVPGIGFIAENADL